MYLTKQQLMQIEGGGLKIGLAIAAGIVFITGIIDGFVRPYRCR